ncbi:MAG: 3-hydroxyacyl-CoA dehydrogenase family protein [Armatimonadetes bacterium]|nr:3-hydroxyacyl-CoA dehydrogenase family protein [Armatimonadota bacterium]
MNTVQNIAVIGAGLMGHAIAQEFAVAGFSVRLYDLTEEVLHQAILRIEGNLKLLAAHGRIPETAVEPALKLIRTTPDLKEAVQDADIVIEAVFEDLPLKLRIFKELDDLCPAHTILASNTSTFMPSLLANATQRPDRVIVAHYFNPPYFVPLVEVVSSPHTSPETKTPILNPGFVANRLQAALIREAFAIVQEGVASPQEVDVVVRTGIGRRLAVAGPFEIAEAAGWDLWSAVAAQLVPTLSNSPEVPQLLIEQVAKGELGVKSGKGFYTWGGEEVASLRRRMAFALLEMSGWDEPLR